MALSVEDKIIQHQVFLQRVSRTLENIAVDSLSSSEKKAIKAIRKRIDKIRGLPFGRKQAAKFRDLENAINEIRKEAINLTKTNMIAEFKELATNESVFMARLLDEGTAGDTAITALTTQQINNIVNFTAITGSTINDLFKNLTAADTSRAMSSVRSGFALGETTDEIVRNLAGTAAADFTDGILNISRTSARTIVRTLTNGIANATKMEIYKQNADVIFALVYSATLDSRTSAICRGLDGTVWKMPEEIDQVQVPPLHPNCRSTIVAAPDEESIRTERPAERRDFQSDAQKRYDDAQREKDGKRRFKDLAPTTQRRKVLDEQRLFKSQTGKNPFVLTKNTYEEFFNRQPASFQKDVLGPTRFQLFKKGGMKLDKFTDFNNKDQFTIAELRVKDKAAFTKAGLE